VQRDWSSTQEPEDECQDNTQQKTSAEWYEDPHIAAAKCEIAWQVSEPQPRETVTQDEEQTNHYQTDSENDEHPAKLRNHGFGSSALLARTDAAGYQQNSVALKK
jgi:hypothetical protein